MRSLSGKLGCNIRRECNPIHAGHRVNVLFKVANKTHCVLLSVSATGKALMALMLLLAASLTSAASYRASMGAPESDLTEGGDRSLLWWSTTVSDRFTCLLSADVYNITSCPCLFVQCHKRQGVHCCVCTSRGQGCAQLSIIIAAHKVVAENMCG